jgi:hypothetical protein
MSTLLIEKIEQLGEGSDFTDPATYAKLLYGDEPAQPAAEPAPAAAPAPQPQGETAPAESSATPAAAETTQPEPAPAGVATRDGKHVIPYTVLEQERQQRRDAEKRAAEMQAELQRLKEAGATSQQQSAAIESMFSAEELEELAEDAPAVKKLHDAYTALAAKVKADEAAKEAERAARQQAVQDESQDVAAAQANAALASLPLLTKWRDAGGGLWQDAVALDKHLVNDPVWAAKSMTERFAEVQSRIATQYGIPIPGTPAPSPTPTPTPQQPKPAAEVLPTLTDFNGGTVVVGKDPLAGLAPGQMVDKAMDMDMEALRKLAGLSY